MNTAIIYVSREILEDILKGLEYGYKTNTPKDMKILSIIPDYRTYNPLRFAIYAESSEFEKVAEGDEYPIFYIYIERIQP